MRAAGLRRPVAGCRSAPGLAPDPGWQRSGPAPQQPRRHRGTRSASRARRPRRERSSEPRPSRPGTRGTPPETGSSGRLPTPDDHTREQCDLTEALRPPKAGSLRPMQELVLAWWSQNRVDLPWRHTHDPYAILVSEVMLQQTQVSRVVPRYLGWLERWPTVEALAAVPTADVIREWQGLGYHRRAVSLHRAAQLVAAHGWPDDLTELPGVGP